MNLTGKCQVYEHVVQSGQLSFPDAVAESVVSGSILTPRSCSTGDGMQVSTGTDAGGEEKDLPSFVDAPDPGSIFDEAMSKAEENTALSIPSTAGDDSTQQEALDKHRQAQPPFSSQSPCSGPDPAPSEQLATITMMTNRMSCELHRPED